MSATHTLSRRKRSGTPDTANTDLLGHVVALCSQPLSRSAVVAIVLLEILISFSVVKFVPYTEIDWQAYMQQVDTFQAGELDYINIKGSTGPLVYPAGFLYIFSALKALCGGGSNIASAQLVFIGIYAINSLVVLLTYRRAQLPALSAIPLFMSKRIHSIFVLRLFNDCIASLFAHSAVLALSYSKMKTAATLLSLGVSVKMNVGVPAWQHVPFPYLPHAKHRAFDTFRSVE
jgi:alpha-1,3-mannosyltransferase